MLLKAVRCQLILGAALAIGFDTSHAVVAAISASTPAKQVKDSDPGPIKPIIDGMQGAGARLKRGDTGPGTRTIQEQVVNDLQKLIDAAKPKSQENKQQPNSGSRQETGSQNRPQPQENPSADATSEPAGNGQPGRKSGSAKPSPSEKKSPGSPQRPLLREVWGHLPPALRERVASDFHEAILPAYDDLIRRYFEALLDGSTPTGANRQAPLRTPIQGPPTQGSPAQ
jgi:hypothetical protein